MSVQEPGKECDNEHPDSLVQQWSLRVRYAETDAMGVVHHASYLPWCELARVEWLRAYGHSYRDLEEQGMLLPVTRAEVQYKRSCHFDDQLILETKPQLLGRAQLRFLTSILLDDRLIACAEVDLACVNPQGRPRRLPANLTKLIEQASPPS